MNTKLFTHKQGIDGARPFTDIDLRDVFAAFAMAGLLAGKDTERVTPSPSQLAEMAYTQADAMLSIRAEYKEGKE